jgi:hypothetical protein
MAILVRGMKCQLCGCPMLNEHSVVTFSPFVANEADPLFFFSDGAFHSECFHKHPLADKAEIRHREVLESRKPINRRCLICGNLITEPNDYLPFGHLTDDATHPLHRFNYSHVHRSCLPRWSELSLVYELAAKELASGAWKGKGMQWLEHGAN